MSNETPLQQLKRLYGSKEKLISNVVDLAKEAGEDAAEAKERLLTVSNRKLLRIARVTEELKSKYGNREKLVAAIGASLGRAKDKDYLTKLSSFSSARLIDLAKSAEKRARRSS